MCVKKQVRLKPYGGAVDDLLVDRGVLFVHSTMHVMTTQLILEDIDVIYHAQRKRRVSQILYTADITERDLSLMSIRIVAERMVELLHGRLARVTEHPNGYLVGGMINTIAEQRGVNLVTATFPCAGQALDWLHDVEVRPCDEPKQSVDNLPFPMSDSWPAQSSTGR